MNFYLDPLYYGAIFFGFMALVWRTQSRSGPFRISGLLAINIFLFHWILTWPFFEVFKLFATLFLFSVLICFSIPRSERHRRIVSLTLCSIVLIFFGFARYFPKLHWLGDPIDKSRNLLPNLGAAFLLFRCIHLSIDLGRGTLTPANPFFVLNYLTFFPTFISGPIERLQIFSKNAQFSKNPILPAVFRIVDGLFRKIVLAPILWPLTLQSLDIGSLQDLNRIELAFAANMYWLYLFLDFSGYSQIAIGSAQLLGFSVLENFNRPYLACSIPDFWGRWHISLAVWVKDYIFFPLSRWLYALGLVRPMVITSTAAFIAFFLTGIWHGRGTSYVFLGLFYGAAFVVYYKYVDLMKKYYANGYKKLKTKKLYLYTSRALTIEFFALIAFVFLKGDLLFAKTYFLRWAGMK